MATNTTYHWKIKTAASLGAGTDARLRLSLHGDRGNMNFAWLLPESTMKDRALTEVEMNADLGNYWYPQTPVETPPRAFARNTVTFGRFPSCPSIGNLLSGVLLSDGSGLGADWEVVSVRIKEEDTVVWVADNVGLVKGGVETSLTFATEWESKWSPLNVRKRQEQDQRLLETDPQEWLRKRQEQIEDLRRTTGKHWPDAILPKTRPAAAQSSERTVTEPGQGLTDAQILERDAKKGRPLLSQEGRPTISSIPNRGSDFEGFSFQSAPAVKLADEDESTEI